MMKIGKSEYQIYKNGIVIMNVRSTWGAMAEQVAAKKLNVSPKMLFALPAESSYMDKQIAVTNSISRYKQFSGV